VISRRGTDHFAPAPDAHAVEFRDDEGRPGFLAQPLFRVLRPLRDCVAQSHPYHQPQYGRLPRHRGVLRRRLTGPPSPATAALSGLAPSRIRPATSYSM